ncbi:MAG TPA: GlsB/YeaQ/YmgE family stress response membrane protein [Blastocatellia bacterium]
MSIIALIVSGLIIGVIAKLLMPGRDPGGFIITILLGIAGMFLGSYVGREVGFYKPGQPAGWIVSIIGALVLLALYHLLFIRGRTHRFF